MNSSLHPLVYLACHGETRWSVSGQHSGNTDLSLTERGELDAQRLGERLDGLTFEKVFTSPWRRARRTSEFAGFGKTAEVSRDLAEWDYGDYEGLQTSDILEKRPDWQLFRDGCPYGESPEQIGARTDRVLSRLRAINGNVLLVSGVHFLRIITARWLGLNPDAGRFFALNTASLSILGYEHSLSQPTIQLWNDTGHLRPNQTRRQKHESDSTIAKSWPEPLA